MIVKADKPAWLVAIITFAYSLIGLTGIIHHEVWLDEAHHFLLAQESISLTDLFEKTKYEGHPQLWDILLFVVTRFTHDIFYMQLFNLLIMSLSCFLFLKYSRASLLFGTLVFCSYFFLYEYLVISRSYSLLLLALTSTFISIDQKRTNAIYCSLIFLSLTHVFGIIISLVLCFLLLNKSQGSLKRSIIISIVLFSIFILWSIKVPKDHFLFHYDNDPVFSFKRFSKAGGMFVKGLVPIPEFSLPVRWNSNFLISALGTAGGAIGVIAYFAVLLVIREQKFYLRFYLIATLLIIACMTISPVTMGVRYCGFFFILFIYIICYTFDWEAKVSNRRVVLLLCFVQIIAGIVFFIADLKYEFSNANKVARFIEERDLGNKPIMISSFSSAPAIAAYLDKKIYYPETCEKGNYCKWNTWPFLLNSYQLSSRIETQLASRDTVVLILNQHYYHNTLQDTLRFSNKNITYSLAKRFDSAMVNNENYFLFYVVQK
jgi:hypothetical protein